jgi:hypothetical protein
MKNFHCDVCEKKFIDSYKLRRHLRTHTAGRGGGGAAAVAATPVATVAVATYDPHVVVVEPQQLQKVEPEDQHQHQVVLGQQQHHILVHVAQPQQHHQAVAKRTTIQNFLKFEVPVGQLAKLVVRMMRK